MSEPLTATHAGDHPIYVVAGGNHVKVLLDRSESGDAFDAIEVLAQPGGGPPAHSHEFAEWFQVLEGELTICEERDGTVVCTQVVPAGGSFFVPPWVVHGTLNLSDAPTRFFCVGQPGEMSGYFAEAGVPVPDELTPPSQDPPGPDQIGPLADRYGIKFWTGPVDRTPVPWSRG